MDQNTNPLTNVNPAAGAAPSVPLVAPVPGAQPVADAGTTGATNAPAGQATGMPHMPSIMEALNMAARADAASAADTTVGAGGAPAAGIVGGMDAATANPLTTDAPVQGIAAESAMVSDTATAVNTPSAGMGANQDEVLETLSVASAEVDAVPPQPVGRPTNIDGVYRANTFSPAAGVTGGAAPSASTNPFISTASQQTPSVSFTDPALEPEVPVGQPMEIASTGSQKKKSNKTTLMVLSVIAFLVAAALAAVLVMLMLGVGPFASNNGGSSQTQSSENSNNNTANNTNSGVTNGTQASTGKIACNGTATEGGQSKTLNVIISVANNIITDTDASMSMVDADGNEQTLPMDMNVDGLLGTYDTEGRQNYYDGKGTLKVSMQEFADYLQKSMQASGWTGTCAVR
ncbi:hypothetical protein IIY66_01470 [Candidatus Saccharibacteria bacterium]|nr:hypothetical protein [Candidatus Saccharibacteria bacterium]